MHGFVNKVNKKQIPLCKLLISYADFWQGHYGIIYQATNWYFVENIKSSGKEVFIRVDGHIIEHHLKS